MNYGNYSILDDMRLKSGFEDQSMADLNQPVQPTTPAWQSGAAQGAMQGMVGGSAGNVAMGAGLGAALTPGAFATGAVAGPAGLGVAGAGLLLTQLEAKQKAKQLEEQAIAQEAQNRKTATMNALSNLMATSRSGGVA